MDSFSQNPNVDTPIENHKLSLYMSHLESIINSAVIILIYFIIKVKKQNKTSTNMNSSQHKGNCKMLTAVQTL